MTNKWFELISAFELTEHPEVDRDTCGWDKDSELILAERFINQMGLGSLYEKFLDQQAAEELGEDEIEPDRCEQCQSYFDDSGPGQPSAVAPSLCEYCYLNPDEEEEE